MKKQTKTLLLAVVLLVVVFFGERISNASSHVTTDISGSTGFEVHYIDVGQADAALIVCDGHAMLIDGGNTDDSSLMYSYLENLGIDSLDCVVATHAHEDHVGGLSGALSYAKTEIAYCPVTEYDSRAFSNFVKVLAKQSVSITVPHHGDSFELGSALVQFFAPIGEYESVNDSSIVTKITYGETSFLFMGDAETASISDLLDSGYDLKCDVLKVGHHGSNDANPYRLIYDADPEYAVISCGKDNPYGHPHEEVLSRLSDAEVKLYRTDLNGTIICKSDGSALTFTTEKG